MKKNLWIGLLVIAVAALSMVVIKQSWRAVQSNEQLSSAAAKKAKASTAPPASAPKRPVQPPPVSHPIESVPAPATEGVPNPAVAPAAEASASTGTTSNFFSGLASMMKNPQMKEMVRAQQKMMVDQQFGSLSKYLNLTVEQQDALKNLLQEREMATVDAGLAMMGGSDADRKQAMEDAKSIQAEYNQKIKDLLGPQDFQMFQDYEKTVTERTQVQMFKGRLPNDAALTDQQEYDLLSAMYEARNSLPTPSLPNNQNTDPTQLTTDQMAWALRRMELLQQAYADRAKGILTPTQYEQFVQWQQQMSAMQAAAMKMTQQMFGSRGASQPPAGNQGQTP